MTSWEETQKALADQYALEKWGGRPPHSPKPSQEAIHNYARLEQIHEQGSLTKHFADLIWDRYHCLAKHSVFKAGKPKTLRVRGPCLHTVGRASIECISMIEWLGNRYSRHQHEQDRLSAEQAQEATQPSAKRKSETWSSIDWEHGYHRHSAGSWEMDWRAPATEWNTPAEWVWKGSLSNPEMREAWKQCFRGWSDSWSAGVSWSEGRSETVMGQSPMEEQDC